MVKLLLRVIFPLLILSAMSVVSLAQESEEPCSSRDTVYPRSAAAIRDEASHAGDRVRKAVPWEPLEVLGSKHQGPWCWLEVEGGWLIDSALVLSATLRDAATAAASATGRSCYAAEMAYVVGNMNIRAGASTAYGVVANARAGDVFTVSASAKGIDWCWLKIEQGWLANTSRVRSTKPVYTAGATSSVARQPSQQSDIDNCCFVDRQCSTDQEWEDGYWAYQKNQCGGQGHALSAGIIIEGSEEFVANINAALDLLRRRAPQWYAYVTKGPRKIVEVQPPAADGSASHDHFFISSSAARKPTHLIAWLMGHEACHVQRSLAGLFRYTTPLEVDFEEFLCDYVAHTSQQQVNYGRLIMAYTPSQVARLIRDGKVEQPTGTGYWHVAYIPGEVRQLLLAGMDFFGALRTEIARADRLLHN